MKKEPVSFNLYGLFVEEYEWRAAHISMKQPLQQEFERAFYSQAAELRTGSAIEFDPGYTPGLDGEEEFFEIPDFILPPHLQSLLMNPGKVPPASAGQVATSSLRGLVGVAHMKDPADATMMFQLVRRNQILRPEKFAILLSGEGFERLQTPVLSIDDRLVAVYTNRALALRSEHLARGLFDLTRVFQAASDLDLEVVAAKGVFKGVGSHVFKQLADTPLRRKLGRLLGAGALDGITVEALRSEAKELGMPLATVGSGKHLALAPPQTRKELKHLVNLVTEAYSRGPFTKRVYLSNSHRVVKSPGGD